MSDAAQIQKRRLCSEKRRCEVMVGNALIDVNERQQALCVLLSDAVMPVKLHEFLHIWNNSNIKFGRDLEELRDKLALAGAEITYYPKQGYVLEVADAE